MVLTTHAKKRMQMRRITQDDIRATVEHGRTIYARGAVIKIIGKKEIGRYRNRHDLRHLDGVHVVLDHDGVVITTYHNRQFHQSDFRKPRRRPRRI